MRLLDAWDALPEPERTARLKALRSCAWFCLGQGAAPLAVACQTAEIGVPGAMDAVAEQLEQLPTLSQRRLLSALASIELNK